jgi:hypothetical protein
MDLKLAAIGFGQILEGALVSVQSRAQNGILDLNLWFLLHTYLTRGPWLEAVPFGSLREAAPASVHRWEFRSRARSYGLIRRLTGES